MYDDTDDMLLGSSSGMEGPLLDGLQILWQVKGPFYRNKKKRSRAPLC